MNGIQSRNGGGPDVYLTVDLEPDCPPFLSGWQGMEQGAPFLLDLLRQEGVAATFFTTGETAAQYPGFVRALVDEGHELGCHGHSHRSFRTMTESEARAEVEHSSAVLRRYSEVTSFRAPYLQLPIRYRKLLASYSYRVDSSLARYKPAYYLPRPASPVNEIAVSITSSALRLDPRLRDPWLRRLSSPVVLFVHPWEFVDLTRERLRWDCRLGTGAHARGSLRQVIRLYRAQGARFRLVRDWR